MNGLGCSDICRLFFCPPCPSKIAAKVAFLPPEPSYSIGTYTFISVHSAVKCCSVPDDNGSRYQLHLTERAEWQHTQRERDLLDVYYAKTSSGQK